MKPCRIPLYIRLEKQLAIWAKREAKRTGLSLSEFIRRAVLRQ
jgi:hypothetical protein